MDNFEYYESRQVQIQLKRIQTANFRIFAISSLTFFCVIIVGSCILHYQIASVEEKLNEVNHNVSTSVNKMDNNMKQLTEEMKKINRSNSEIFVKIFPGSSSKNVFQLKQNNRCLDTQHFTHNESIVLHECHSGWANQEWHLTSDGKLKNSKSCLSFEKKTSEIQIQHCNQSPEQIWKFSEGIFRNPKHGLCLQSHANKAVPGKCNPTAWSQIFKIQILYTIDRYCTFKQGSYVFPGDGKWAISIDGFVVNNATCLTYDESTSSSENKECDSMNDYQKWEFTPDRQLRNVIFNVCVGQKDKEIVIDKCDMTSKSQRWTCD